MKRERIKKKIYGTREQARSDIFDYIEMFYHSKGRHSSSDQMPPTEYENQYYQRLRSVQIIRGDSVPTRYSQSPSLHLKGNWLAESGFDTGRGVTVKISQGCIVLMAENNEMQELRKHLRDIKQANQEMKNAAKAALQGMGIYWVSG
nr:SymE family type I addiction module toxin [Enterobacter sp. ENT03]